MFSSYVSWQKQIEELHKKYESLKEERFMLQLICMNLSLECPETSNEDKTIEVHHLNSFTYLFVELFTVHSIEVLRFLDNNLFIHQPLNFDDG